jgi:hypothetical protein
VGLLDLLAFLLNLLEGLKPTGDHLLLGLDILPLNKARQDVALLAKAMFQLLHLLFRLGEFLGEAIAIPQSLPLLLLVPLQLLLLGLALLLLLLVGFEAIASRDLLLLTGGDAGLYFTAFGIEYRLVLELLGNGRELLFEQIELPFILTRLLTGLVGEVIVGMEFEQVRQNLLPFPRTLEHEGIGLTLAQVGGVDKGFVV